MSLKMMKSTFVLSALVAMTSLAAVGCGEEDEPKDSGANPPPTGDGGVAPPTSLTASGTLVAITAADDSAPIAVPHKIVILNAETGAALVPALETTTAAVTGKWEIKGIPSDIVSAIHVQGAGDPNVTTSTYDSIILPVKTGVARDPLTRISSSGTAALAGMVAGFTARDDTAAVSGALYVVDDRGVRTGTIGCAKVYLDDEPHPATSADMATSIDQRYVGENGLPAPIATTDKTKPTGRFYFGNVNKGSHTFKVSMDDGKTFLNEAYPFVVNISVARQDAVSPKKAVLYQLGIDIKLATNPTPAGCF